MKNYLKHFAALGLSLGAAYTYAQISARDKYRVFMVNSEHFKKSVNLVKGYQPVLDLLGEPITADTVELNDPYTQVDDFCAQLSIPIHGTKKNGILLTKCSRKSIDDDWEVDSLDFKRVDNSKQWTFYVGKRKQHEDSETKANVT
ncbi:uncharacterized protein LOC127718920 [Mytilus californianus]|uniref:uncharacterized protein LOC127718920 n=1 Tax=Mytilus californianus TaxID=6549 RepID=UPI0022466697|nr:uncharacterized protein LOC127718920 [Mytilus californianus]